MTITTDIFPFITHLIIKFKDTLLVFLSTNILHYRNQILLCRKF